MAEKKKGIVRQFAANEVKNAPKASLEDLFENYYHHRREIYVMNFIRGIFFGFGSLIGGTLVVALLLWILSILHYVPFLDGVTDAVQHTLDRR